MSNSDTNVKICKGLLVVKTESGPILEKVLVETKQDPSSKNVKCRLYKIPPDFLDESHRKSTQLEHDFPCCTHCKPSSLPKEFIKSGRTVSDGSYSDGDGEENAKNEPIEANKTTGKSGDVMVVPTEATRVDAAKSAPLEAKQPEASEIKDDGSARESVSTSIETAAPDRNEVLEQPSHAKAVADAEDVSKQNVEPVEIAIQVKYRKAKKPKSKSSRSYEDEETMSKEMGSDTIVTDPSPESHDTVPKKSLKTVNTVPMQVKVPKAKDKKQKNQDENTSLTEDRRSSGEFSLTGDNETSLTTNTTPNISSTSYVAMADDESNSSDFEVERTMSGYDVQIRYIDSKLRRLRSQQSKLYLDAVKYKARRSVPTAEDIGDDPEPILRKISSEQLSTRRGTVGKPKKKKKRPSLLREMFALKKSTTSVENSPSESQEDQTVEHLASLSSRDSIVIEQETMEKLKNFEKKGYFVTMDTSTGGIMKKPSAGTKESAGDARTKPSSVTIKKASIGGRAMSTIYPGITASELSQDVQTHPMPNPSQSNTILSKPSPTVLDEGCQESPEPDESETDDPPADEDKSDLIAQSTPDQEPPTSDDIPQPSDTSDAMLAKTDEEQKPAIPSSSDDTPQSPETIGAMLGKTDEEQEPAIPSSSDDTPQSPETSDAILGKTDEEQEPALPSSPDDTPQPSVTSDATVAKSDEEQKPAIPSSSDDTPQSPETIGAMLGKTDEEEEPAIPSSSDDTPEPEPSTSDQAHEDSDPLTDEGKKEESRTYDVPIVGPYIGVPIGNLYAKPPKPKESSEESVDVCVCKTCNKKKVKKTKKPKCKKAKTKAATNEVKVDVSQTSIRTYIGSYIGIMDDDVCFCYPIESISPSVLEFLDGDVAENHEGVEEVKVSTNQASPPVMRSISDVLLTSSDDDDVLKLQEKSKHQLKSESTSVEPIGQSSNSDEIVTGAGIDGDRSIAMSMIGLKSHVFSVDDIERIQSKVVENLPPRKTQNYVEDICLHTYRYNDEGTRICICPPICPHHKKRKTRNKTPPP